MSQTSPETVRAIDATVMAELTRQQEAGVKFLVGLNVDDLVAAIAATLPAGFAQTPAVLEALEFYADPTRYNGPNSRLEGEPDKYQPENLYYRLDVTRDGGRIARRALADTSTDRCICQDQHRRGYCTEPGCPYNRDRPVVSISSPERGSK